MKNLIYLCLVFVFAACSSGNSSLEKVIADFKQTDKEGRLYDLKFKMIEMGEIQKVTVSDSLKILQEEFKAKNDKAIEGQKMLLSMAQKNLDQEKNSRRPSATMIDVHESDIKKYNDKIAELKNKTGDDSKYAGKNPDDVLANIIICTYSMNDLSGNNFTEKSEFLLSPDKSKVYKARRIRK